ncbi:MAG TPA: DUF1800 domain-containing protein [Blastocatellia bacterium]|nr:DUF1800 domain-containing protein [Blastocatellia bacterium]
MPIEERVARHIYARMAFGGTPAEIDDLVNRSASTEAAVDYMIEYGQINNQSLDDVLQRSFNFSLPLSDQRFSINQIRRWWVTRMVYSKRQFEEKMTLFWHNHFATANTKVNSAAQMFIQNELLRKNALARFDDLAMGISKDPAMMVWLDTNQNTRAGNNENYGRELMELFTMGIFDPVSEERNYVEDDVKQVARTFTGWQFFLPDRNNPLNYQFRINANLHDSGQKTIFAGTDAATTGNLGGEDVVTIICNRVATPRFLAKKLLDFFVFPVDLNSKADRKLIKRLAKAYVKNNHSIKALVRAVFTSDEFFSDRAMNALVKQPIEFVVGPIRMLGASYNPGGPVDRADATLYQRSAQLTQNLLDPPDVSGWDLQLAWINTAVLLQRYNVANTFATSRPAAADAPGAFITLDQLKQYVRPTPEQTAKAFLSTLKVDWDEATLASLVRYLTTDDNGNPTAWTTTDANVDKKCRGLVHLIMSLPEFQLN